MSGIKIRVGSGDLTANRTETKRAGEGTGAKETQGAGKQSFEAEAGVISVSNRAAQVGRLVEKVKDAPDIRHEQVEALRRKIETGEYNPPAAEIADAILKDEK
jgi:flagellar biosynthesis anti-sigma factor FlgM